jgi:uncharacterized membrane protein YeaQ/YmgE (transglycosylase-associated protein family)
MDTTSFLVWIVVGAIAGLLADSVVKGIGVGLVGAILIGIVGGLIGGWLFAALGVGVGLGILGQILVAFVGAVILLLIVRAVRGSRV